MEHGGTGSREEEDPGESCDAGDPARAVGLFSEQRTREDDDENRREKGDRRSLGERQIAQPSEEADRGDEKECRAQKLHAKATRPPESRAAALPCEGRDYE